MPSHDLWEILFWIWLRDPFRNHADYKRVSPVTVLKYTRRLIPKQIPLELTNQNQGPLRVLGNLLCLLNKLNKSLPGPVCPASGNCYLCHIVIPTIQALVQIYESPFTFLRTSGTLVGCLTSVRTARIFVSRLLQQNQQLTGHGELLT